jgi:hypothetical protein
LNIGWTKVAELSGTGNGSSEANRLALWALLIGEASGVFAGFCPSWFTVSSPFFHEQDAKEGNVKRIRWGEAAATAICVGTGAAMTKISGDKSLLLVSVLISGVFVAGYEFMIAHPATEDGDEDSGPNELSSAPDNLVEIGHFAFNEVVEELGFGLLVA